MGPRQLALAAAPLEIHYYRIVRHVSQQKRIRPPLLHVSAVAGVSKPTDGAADGAGGDMAIVSGDNINCSFLKLNK